MGVVCLLEAGQQAALLLLGPPSSPLAHPKPCADIMTKPPRRSDDHFITPWIFFRWMVGGGCATLQGGGEG